MAKALAKLFSQGGHSELVMLSDGDDEGAPGLIRVKFRLGDFSRLGPNEDLVKILKKVRDDSQNLVVEIK